MEGAWVGLKRGEGHGIKDEKGEGVYTGWGVGLDIEKGGRLMALLREREKQQQQQQQQQQDESLENITRFIETELTVAAAFDNSNCSR